MEAGGTKDAFFEDKVRQIYIKTVTESNNYTLIEVTNPQANYSLTENNAINIDGNIAGGHDINMRADGGKVEVIYSSRNGEYSNLEHYTGEGIPDLSNADGSVEKGTYATNLLSSDTTDINNNITVNGLVTAGSAVKDVAINISGRVIPEGYNISGTSGSGTLNVVSDIDVNYSEGTIDYANEPATRRQALIDLINQYSTGSSATTENTAAVSGFLAELE